MTKADLLNLAARVEAATGADRALDGFVAIAAGWRLKTVDGVHYWRRGDYSWTAEMEGMPPAFTASVDAAAALVPEGCDWSVARVGGKVSACVSAELRDVAGAVNAATPAIALTAAALRAMAEEAGE